MKFLIFAIMLLVLQANVVVAQTKTPILTTPLMDLGRDEVARDRYKTLKVVVDTTAAETKQLETDVKQRRQELEEIMLCGQYGMLRVPADGELKNWKVGMQIAGTTITQAMCAPALVEQAQADENLGVEIGEKGILEADIQLQRQMSIDLPYAMICDLYDFQIFKYEGGEWTALPKAGTSQTVINVPSTDHATHRHIRQCSFKEDLGVISLEHLGFDYAVVIDNEIHTGSVDHGSYGGYQNEDGSGSVGLIHEDHIFLQNWQYNSATDVKTGITVYKRTGPTSFTRIVSPSYEYIYGAYFMPVDGGIVLKKNKRSSSDYYKLYYIDKSQFADASYYRDNATGKELPYYFTSPSSLLGMTADMTESIAVQSNALVTRTYSAVGNSTTLKDMKYYNTYSRCTSYSMVRQHLYDDNSVLCGSNANTLSLIDFSDLSETIINITGETRYTYMRDGDFFFAIDSNSPIVHYYKIR